MHWMKFACSDRPDICPVPTYSVIPHEETAVEFIYRRHIKVRTTPLPMGSYLVELALDEKDYLEFLLKYEEAEPS